MCLLLGATRRNDHISQEPPEKKEFRETLYRKESQVTLKEVFCFFVPDCTLQTLAWNIFGDAAGVSMFSESTKASIEFP